VGVRCCILRDRRLHLNDQEPLVPVNRGVERPAQFVDVDSAKIATLSIKIL
jgi:hypothetical protein